MTSNSTESNPALLYDWASLLGRIGLAVIFLHSGYAIFAYTAANVGYMRAYGMPAAELLIWPAAIVQGVAGAMLVLGWKTRWAALALIVFTIPATFIFHAYWGVPAGQVASQQIHFMKNLAILGGLLSVFAHGSGRYGLDRP